jgi:pyruvate dehydrogenase E1 component
VDRYYVVEAALHALADDGVIPSSQVVEAQRKYALDPAKPNPTKV